VKKKVLDDPLVKEALEIFQGEVLEVKVNDEDM